MFYCIILSWTADYWCSQLHYCNNTVLWWYLLVEAVDHSWDQHDQCWCFLVTTAVFSTTITITGIFDCIIQWSKHLATCTLYLINATTLFYDDISWLKLFVMKVISMISDDVFFDYCSNALLCWYLISWLRLLIIHEINMTNVDVSVLVCWQMLSSAKQ